MKKRVFNFIDIIVIVTLTSLIMCFLGGVLVFKHLGGVDFSVLGNDKNIKEFVTAYNDLKDKYYEDVDSKTLIDNAIKGMYSAVKDPYTSYLDDNDTNNLNSILTGKYRGVGIEIEKSDDDNIKIVRVLDNSPASKAGLKSGDIITQIDLVDVKGKSSTDLANMIGNSSSDSVNFTIKRGDEILSIKVDIKMLYDTVSNEKVISYNDKKIGYISLSSFSEDSYNQFSSNLEKLDKENIDSLIIDLRGNTGGYLNSAYKIAELFIKKGKTIYSLESKSNKEVYKDKTKTHESYNIIVLTNKNTASASEVLAAALRDSYGAKLLGTTSYGKGKVQEKSSLTDGTTVKYTTAKWLTPTGECIDGVGLEPDISVEYDEKAYDGDNILTDNQVKAAAEEITK